MYTFTIFFFAKIEQIHNIYFVLKIVKNPKKYKCRTEDQLYHVVSMIHNKVINMPSNNGVFTNCFYFKFSCFIFLVIYNLK